MGGLKGSSKNMTVGKEGKEKIDPIKRKKFQIVSLLCLAQFSPSREHGGT
jgi:hypothetical protein